MGSERGSVKNEADALNELSKLNAQEFGKIIDQKEHKAEEEKGDIFQMGKDLRMERQRQRAE